MRKAELIEALGPGYFIAESYRVVDHLLNSSIQMYSILGTSEWMDQLGVDRITSRISQENILVRSQAEMQKIVGFNLHQGIMAIGKRPEEVRLEELGSQIIVFNGVVNPENIGSITRTGVALGYRSFLVDVGSADPFLRRAVRVSMGSVFLARIHRSLNLFKSLSELQRLGWSIIGSGIRKPTAFLPKYQFPKKFALVVGSEFNGMDLKVTSICDEVLAIPSETPMNAASAASILMYTGKL